jgi:hypothetical protein
VTMLRRAATMVDWKSMMCLVVTGCSNWRV